MPTPTIEQIYDTQIRLRSREERRRLIEIAERDLDKEDRLPPQQDPTLALFAKWKEEDSKMSTEELEAEKASWDEFKANINIVDEQYAGTVESYGKLSLAGIKKMLKGLVVAQSGSFKTTSGITGYRVVFTAVYGDKKMRQISYALPGKGATKLVFTFSCLAQEGAKYDKVVDASINSFVRK